MSRLLRASILLLLLASCGGGRYSAPRNLDDACAILRERPKYHRAMKATERKWGVPVAVQMAVIHQESKFIGNAQTAQEFYEVMDGILAPVFVITDLVPVEETAGATGGSSPIHT